MRKIVNKEQEKKKRQRGQIIIGVVLLLLMLLSTVGYSFQGGMEDQDPNVISKKYGSYNFVSSGGYWETEINEVRYSFFYHPSEVEYVGQVFRTINEYYNQPVYIYSEDFQAESEIYRNIYPIAGRMQNACPEGKICENAPTKDCSNNFIIIKEASENKISSEGKCSIIEGKKEDLPKLADEFLFKALGIKQ